VLETKVAIKAYLCQYEAVGKERKAYWLQAVVKRNGCGRAMLVLHAVWYTPDPTAFNDVHLSLWAEDSQTLSASQMAKKGRNGAKTSAYTNKRGAVAPFSPHPYAASLQLLEETVEELTGGLFSQIGKEGSLLLNLPTENEIVQVSSALWEFIPSQQSTAQPETPSQAESSDQIKPEKPNFAVWKVPTLDFAPANALELLLALPSQPSGQAQRSFGTSLIFWQEGAKLAHELLVRQDYVPFLQIDTIAATEKSALKPTRTRKTSPTKGEAVAVDSKIYRALWRPLLSQPEHLPRFKTLARAMPQVCRSYLSADAAPTDANQKLSRTDRNPLWLVENFLNRTVDAALRHSFEQHRTTMLTITELLAGRKGSITKGKDAKFAGLFEQWLSNLFTTKNSPLNGTPAELDQFTTALAEWATQILPDTSSQPLRTCFKLDPPPVAPENTPAGAKKAANNPPANWHLSFYLQANDDRSLLIPAEQVWRERSGTLTFVKRQFENPQERLLADLGRASRLFPPLDQSLTAARPTGLNLTTAEAYNFLREAAPLLEQSGYSVLLPSWWSKPSGQLGIKLRLKPGTSGKGKGKSAIGQGLLSQNSLVEYDWQVALGDTTLSPAEFAKLANLKVPLVQVRGEWVELRPEQIEAALNFFEKQHAGGQMGLIEALQIGLSDGEAANVENTVPIVEVEAEGWLAPVLDKLGDNTKLEPVTQPSGLHATLRPYQLKGLAWLNYLQTLGLGACLADDMGLGKTISLISLLLHERETVASSTNDPVKADEAQTGLEPTLIVCPMSVVGNWSKELARFAPELRVMVHHGADRKSGGDFEETVRDHNVVLTTYSLLQRDESLLAAIKWRRVVLDEAQNVKNPAAKQSQAARRLGAQSAYRVALTGTPVENRLSELWSINEFLNPGYLGSAASFRNRFITPIEKYRNPEQAQTLKKLITPFVLRRLKTDKSIISDLPDKLEMKVWCNLTSEQATLYEAIVKEMLGQIENEADEGIRRKGLVLAALTRLKQVCNHPAHYLDDNSPLAGRSGKLSRLEEMLEEVLAVGDKALIFTQFSEFGGRLQTHLSQRLGREVLFLHGGTPKKARDEMVARYQSGTGAPLFILSLKAGGVGLNLTAANHVFHFDRWWNPAVENQATDRAFRIGQIKNVQVHKFVCIGTMEEKIDMLIEQKKELAENVVGAGETWLTELDNRQLRDLLTLRRDAVSE
jgi:SNF2 family DNA or RNA helicase